MPMKRCPSQLQVPPPSPIPKASGSRSAANERLAEFLDKSLHCPELTLPESHFPAMAHALVPAEIDYRSLSSAAINLLVRSAREFGAFRISGHGISAQELGRVEEEAERVMLRAGGNANSSRWIVPAAVERNRRGEMIPCVQSRKGTLQFIASKSFGFKSHRNFWIHMGNIASKLDSIVEKVSVALEEHKSQEFKEQIQETETVICLSRYPHGNVGEGDHHEASSSSSSSNKRLHDHALRFYLPMEHCIFYIQSGRGPLSFDAGPDTIVVTVGKQLEEWSRGEFKCVPAEMIFMPSFQSSQQASFAIELKFFHTSKKSDKIISLTDQILIVLCLAFLYNFLLLFFSH